MLGMFGRAYETSAACNFGSEASRIKHASEFICYTRTITLFHLIAFIAELNDFFLFYFYSPHFIKFGVVRARVFDFIIFIHLIRYVVTLLFFQRANEWRALPKMAFITIVYCVYLSNYYISYFGCSRYMLWLMPSFFSSVLSVHVLSTQTIFLSFLIRLFFLTLNSLRANGISFRYE